MKKLCMLSFAILFFQCQQQNNITEEREFDMEHNMESIESIF